MYLDNGDAAPLFLQRKGGSNESSRRDSNSVFENSRMKRGAVQLTC